MRLFKNQPPIVQVLNGLFLFVLGIVLFLIAIGYDFYFAFILLGMFYWCGYKVYQRHMPAWSNRRENSNE